MNLIKDKAFNFFIITVIIFIVALEMKNFGILIFGIACLIISLAIKVKKRYNLFIPIISLLVAFSLCELFLGLTNFFDKKTYFADGTGYTENYGLKINDNGYDGNPGEYSFKMLSQEGEVIYDVVYTIGEDGFRTDVTSTNANVYIYGGSFVFGEGLNDNETLSYFLNIDHGIKSKNVGFHGWGMHNALYNLYAGPRNEKGGVNILLTAPWHALRSSCKQIWTAQHPKYVMFDKKIIQSGICDAEVNTFISKVLRKSYIYRILMQLSDDDILSNRDIELWLALINKIYEISKSRGTALIVAYIDSTEEELSTTNWSNQRLISALKKISDVTIDVTLANRIEDLNKKYTIHKLDQHPSAIANKHRAEVLSTFVKDFQNYHQSKNSIITKNLKTFLSQL